MDGLRVGRRRDLTSGRTWICRNARTRATYNLVELWSFLFLGCETQPFESQVFSRVDEKDQNKAWLIGGIPNRLYDGGRPLDKQPYLDVIH